MNDFYATRRMRNRVPQTEAAAQGLGAAQSDDMSDLLDDDVSTQATTPAEIQENAGREALPEQTPHPQTRPEMRQPMREEDPMTRAARRAEELRDHGALDSDTTDEFYVDPDIVPPGWTYEWKRKITMGAEDPAYQVHLRKAGWEPVPTARHPELMPLDGRYPVIERKGMVLMERPKEINDEAQHREYQKARNQVRQKEQQLSSADSGQFERSNKGDSLVKVKKTFEHVPIPE